MASLTDDLMEHLLEKITFRRSKGFTAAELEEAIKDFYKCKNDSSGEENVVDEKFIEAAWERLREHEHVEIQEQESSQPSGEKRIFTSEDRLWQMIAGHERDVNRLPGMEFELLVTIAQHGPEGVLQSTAGRITGQDKHSVPARTDRLAKKGYITKVSVMAEKTRTSLLRLKKWAQSAPSSAVEGGMLHYDVLFDKTIALLKESGNIMSMDDLCNNVEMKVKMRRKMFLRSCVRLSQTGCTRLLRCRVMDEDGDPIMLRNNKVEKTTRAIQLLREPTAEDKSVWSNFRSRSGPYQERRDRKSGVEEELSAGGSDDASEEENAEDDEDVGDETDEEADMPSPSTDTPSRKSKRVRTPSSLAKTIDYAQLFEEEKDDAEHDITESASPGTQRRPAKPLPTKRTAQQRKASNHGGSAVRPLHGFPQTIDGPNGSTDARFSVFTTTPAPAVAAVVGTVSEGKRQRKKSIKALEADALRAASEPMLIEPVEGSDAMNNCDAQTSDDSGEDVDSDRMDVDPKTPDPDGGPPRTKRPRKKRESAKKNKSSAQNTREPIVKKREIPPAEYEEYERYAQATAERLVQVEMKKGMKRTATMAGLDDNPADSSNKAPRIDDEQAGDEVEDKLPTARIAQLKASILARSDPGIYINPPGARNLKLENYVQRGRPRNAIIAVVKHPALKDLPWWRDDEGPRFAPKASQKRTARIGLGLKKFGRDRSEFSAEGREERQGEGRVKKRRRVGGGRGDVGGQSVSTFGGDGVRDEEDVEEHVEEAENTPPTTLRRISRIVRRTSIGFNIGPIDDSDDEERSESDAEEPGTGDGMPDDPTAKAKKELAALRRIGRPSHQDRIRIRILERRIEGAEAEREGGRGGWEFGNTAQEAVVDEAGRGDAVGEDVAAMQRGVVGDANDVRPVADAVQESRFTDTDNASILNTVDIADDALPGAEAIEEPEVIANDKPSRANAVDEADDARTGAEAVEGLGMDANDHARHPIAADKAHKEPPGPSAPKQVNNPPSQPRSPAQTELDNLLAIGAKKRTPENRQRIEDLKSQIEDEYINGPGTIEELLALKKKPGRGTALGIKRRKTLEKRFPVYEASKAREESLPAGSGADRDGEDVATMQQSRVSEEIAVPSTALGAGNDALVIPGEQLASAFQSTATTLGLPAAQSPALPSATDDGRLQTPLQSTLLNRTAPQTFLMDPNISRPTNGVPATSIVDGKASAITVSVTAGSSTTLGPPSNSTTSRPIFSKKVELFTKEYVDSHPDQHFYYRGGGKYARGERFSRAYVEKHPEEKLHPVFGEGNAVKYARGEGPGDETRGVQLESAPVVAEQSRQDSEPQRLPTALHEQHSASVPEEQAQLVVEVNGPKGAVPAEPRDAIPAGAGQTLHTEAQVEQTAQIEPEVEQTVPAGLQEGMAPAGSIPSGIVPIRQAESSTSANTPAQPLSWRKQRALDPEERYTKEYVTAHPEEKFYHRGKGSYSRGEAVSQEYVDAHPEETFKTVGKKYIRLPGPLSLAPQKSTPAVRTASAPSTPVNQGAVSFKGAQAIYNREYVDNHPDETFYHRGGGYWYSGLPPPGSGFKTGVRGPGAEAWKENALRERDEREDAALASSADRAIAQRGPPVVPSAAVPVPASVIGSVVASKANPAPAPKATPFPSMLTIYKPYSPRAIRKAVSSPVAPTATTGHETAQQITEAALQDANVQMVDRDDAVQVSTLSANMNGNDDMDDDESDDEDMPQYEDGNEDGPPVTSTEPHDETLAGANNTSLKPQTYPNSGNRIFFPVDLTAAIVVRRTDKQKQKQKEADSSKAARMARLQTVSKPDDDEHVTAQRGTEPAKKYASRVRKPAKGPRMPARGSKASRELIRRAQQAWPFGISSQIELPAQALALLMHPVESFHTPSGTFGTAAENISPPEHIGGRALRNRTSLAKLPQILEDDFCATPGMMVKLKINNLESVLPPNTAFESGLFATNAASGTVPMSRITGKPTRGYHRRSKKVTFQVNDSDGDEFRDDGEVEDEDEISGDSGASEEEQEEEDEDDGAVARPERRKRSRGVNGELRLRDMASGPAFRDADRLVIAFALVAALCGGLRVEGINWTLIAHALGFRYDGGFLRRRWDHYKRTRKAEVDKLRAAIHEPFLAAYQDDDFPRVDFQNLNNTDWPALFDWVQTTVVPHVQLQPKNEGPKVPDLLRTREETEAQFEIKEPASLYDVRLDEYFASSTDQHRRSLITKYTFGNALPGELRPKDQLGHDMALLRSWVRAVAVTKQYNYHPEAAAKKLRQFSPDTLQQVTAELIENKTFSQERKSRMLPGRNYQISNECLQSFRRWPPRPDESRFLRFVAQAWKNINTHFKSNDKLSLVPSASDPEYLVLTNMAAQGMIRMATILPEIKNDYEAPFPKLSPWGYCGPTYETKKVDMSRLKFPIVYTKTAAYKFDHNLLNHVPIPLQPPPFEGEIGARIPFWVDIHGNLIDDVWDMVLRSVLHLLVFRSGITAGMMEQAHGRKLWKWEIEIVLEWMREVGIAVRTVGGGWRAGEWWYCAFAPEVARWKAPAVVE